MDDSGYLGGIGGKLRRKPLRRAAATPYDRPATAARGSSVPASERGGGRWLAKLVDPASRFITSSASRLFSSMFRKRLSAPTAEEAPGEISRFQSAQQIITAVSHDLPIELPAYEAENKNIAAKIPEDNVVLEFEQLIKEKSFTKAQYEHLIDVLRSRTTELDTTISGAHGEKIDDIASQLPATRTDNFSLREDHVADGHAVTPVELAKEYMHDKVSNDSPLSQNWQSHPFHKNKKVQTNSHYGAKKLDLKIPRSLVQLPAKIPESSYLTPRSLGRSGMYKMEGSLYAKVEESLKDGYAGTFSDKTPGNKQAGGQVLKRSSSTLYSDFRSSCPIRRIRQKLGINSSNRIMHSVLPGNIEPRSSIVKKGFQDPSQNPCPDSLDALEETEGNKIPNKAVASGSVQSREMENKILQGMDKLFPSPKRKSMKLKDNPVEESPSNGIHTNPKGIDDALFHKQGRLDVLQENVPSTASMHDNNVVDAGVSDHITLSGNQKPSFQIGEFKDTVVNNIVGSSTIAKYSKGFTFPSINVSFTSELPPTPTLPGPLLEKSMVKKVQSAIPLVTSAYMETSTTQSATNRDSSHSFSTLENCTRLNQVSTSYAATFPALHFEATASKVSSTLATQTNSGNLEGNPSDASPFILNSARQDTAFKFGSNSAAPVAVPQFSGAKSDMVWAVSTVSSSEVGSAPSSLLPDSARSQSALSAKMLSGASNNFSFNSARYDNLSSLDKSTETSSTVAITGLVGTQITQQTSDVSTSLFQSTSENRGNSSLVLAPMLSGASNNFSFNSARSNNSSSLDKSTEAPSTVAITGLVGTQITQQTSDVSTSLFQSTSENRGNNSLVLAPPIVSSTGSSSAAAALSLFPNSGNKQAALDPTIPDANITKFGFGSTEFNNSAKSSLDSSTKTSPGDNITGFARTSGNKSYDGSILPSFGIPSFASSSAASSLFPHVGGNQSALVPTTLSSSSNSLSKLGSGFNNTGSSLTDNSAKISPSFNFTGFGIQSTHISSSSTSQFPLWTNIASSSSLGSSPFGATDTHSKLFSSPSTGAGSSSINAAAAATTTTLPLAAATSALFGSNSVLPTFPTFGSFVSSASSGGFGSAPVRSTFDAPFTFNSSSNPAFSASPLAGTSFTSAGANPSTGSMVQQFSQSGTSSAATVFSAPAVHSTTVQPESQAAVSAQIAQGGTFAMGGGGGGGGNGDKSGRRIIKIRRDKRKK